MKIQILGSGCHKCNQLAENTEQAAKDLSLDYELEKVTDINKIMELGIMMPPALVVNGEVKISGKVPSSENIKELLTMAIK